ncbi:MAG: hypothetical protein K0R00_4198 [Herbinix sp.]|jgi:hypothetical protein|nr:hypothetical protein [Herbinix sp.]
MVLMRTMDNNKNFKGEFLLSGAVKYCKKDSLKF